MNTNHANTSRQSTPRTLRNDALAARQALFSAATRVLSFHAAALDAKVAHLHEPMRDRSPDRDQAASMPR